MFSYRIGIFLVAWFLLSPASLYSEELSVTSPPENFTAISGEIKAVPLTWSMHPNTKILGYVVYRSDSKGSKFKEIVRLPSRYTTSYLDGDEAARTTFKILAKIRQTLVDNKNYYYKITTITGEDRIGDFSESIKATTAPRPSTPLSLKAYSGAAGTVPLNWMPPNDKTVTGYRIYRKSSEDGELLSIRDITGRLTLSYGDKGAIDTPLENGHEYYYAISSINQAYVESYITRIVSGKTKEVPPQVDNVTVSKGTVQNIELTWDPSPIPDLSYYAILKSRVDSSESEKEIRVSADTTSYADENLPDGARYHYQIKAVDVDGLESELSTAASGITKEIPSTPTNLKISMSDDSLIVKWDENPEADIIKYEVYKVTGFLGFEKLGVTAETSFVDNEVKRGSKISYRIVAVDEDGLKSKKSDVISIRIPK